MQISSIWLEILQKACIRKPNGILFIDLNAAYVTNNAPVKSAQTLSFHKKKKP